MSCAAICRGKPPLLFPLVEAKEAKPSVIEAVRCFLPAYLSTSPVLSVVQRRAVWAIQNCRTPMLGGGVYACLDCAEKKFTYH